MSSIKPIDTQIADLEAEIAGLEADIEDNQGAAKATRKIVKLRRAEIKKLLAKRGQSDLFEGGGDGP